MALTIWGLTMAHASGSTGRSSDAIGVLPAYATAGELMAGSLVELKLREKLPAIALMLTVPEPAPESEPPRDLTARIAEAFDRT